MSYAVNDRALSLRDEVEQALMKRKHHICNNRDNLTLKRVRRELEKEMRLPVGSLDTMKDSVRTFVDSILQEEEAVDSQGTTQLPNEVLLTILGFLDHDSFILAMQVCKEWHTAIKGDDVLWKHLALSRFLPLSVRPSRQGSRGAYSTWEATYKKLASSQEACYDCAAITSRRTCGGWKRRALCERCSEGYVESTPGQRLMTKTDAKFFYRLREQDLQALPKLVDVNPIHDKFGLMELYRKQDLRRAAIQRWGGIEEMLKRIRWLPYGYSSQ